MKYFGWICLFILCAYWLVWVPVTAFQKNQVESGYVQKIETIEDSDGRYVFVTINGPAEDGYNYDRRIEFEGEEILKIGQKVRVEKPKEVKPRVVIDDGRPEDSKLKVISERPERKELLK